MPRFIELKDASEEDKKQLLANGIDPSDSTFILDNETGDVYPRDNAPGLGVLGQIGESVRAFAPGASETLLTPLKAAGSVADLIRKGLGSFDPNDPSLWTKTAEGAQRNVERSVGVPDARANWLATGIGRGAGQLATLLGGSGLAALKAGPAAVKGISGVAAGVGGLLNAQSTLERENERQAEQGINEPGLAAMKAAAAGGLGALTDYALGPSRIIRGAVKPTTTAGALGRAGINSLSGGATEGVQQATEDVLVEGKLDPQRELQAAAVGAIVQPAGGLGIDLAMRQPAEPKAEAEAKDPMRLDEPQVDASGAAMTPPELPVQQRLSDSEVDAIMRMPVDAEPPNSNPFWRNLRKGREAGVVNTVEDIRELEAASIDDLRTGDKNDTAVTKALNNIWMRKAQERPAVSAEEAAGYIQTGYYDFFEKTFPKEVGELNKRKKALSDMDKWFAKQAETLPPGDLAIARSNIERAKAQLQEKSLDLLRRWNELHGPVEFGVPAIANKMGERVGTGQGPTYTGPARVKPIIEGEVIDIGGPLPAPKVPLQLPEKSGPSVDPAAAEMARLKQLGLDQERAILSGQLNAPSQQGPGIPSLADQRLSEKAALGAYLKQEGEQGLPFGEQTRYSTIVPFTVHSPAQVAARKLRRYASDGQLQANTYILSGVAAMNDERPLGISLNSEGNMPTAGLVNKLASSLPKAEVEAYKAAGIEEWLNGKGAVSREELQAWMIENGPKVEIKELRPRASDKDSQEQARIEHQLDTQFGDWSAGLDPSAKVRAEFFSRNPAAEALIDRYLELKSGRNSGSADSTIGRYGVEPRPVEEMEGPVELLVRVPFGQRQGLNAELVGNSVSGFMFVGDGFKQKSPLFKTQQEAEQWYKRNPQWTGGHHGESGYNALGFVRANVETLPDGKKVLHLFEVQSDWVQKVRREQEASKRMAQERQEHPERFGRLQTPDHPLLADSNRLTLKAAIQYAMDNGLDGIAISDADTAMITEGHDAAAALISQSSPAKLYAEINANQFGVDTEEQVKALYGDDWQAGTFVEFYRNGRNFLRIDKPSVHRNSRDRALAEELAMAGYGQKEGAYIPQEGGMRLNYDQQLPKIARELTGYEGERVSFGEHWRTKEREDLIFKNPDGSLKTDISARVYPLDKVRKMRDEQSVFSLFGRDKSYYSTIMPPETQKLFRSLVEDIFPALKGTTAYDPFYLISRGTTARMAARNPAGAYIRYVFDEYLETGRDAREVQLYKLAQPFEKFAKSERGKQWIDKAGVTKSWDMTGLTKEEQVQAKAWRDLMEFTRKYANEKGVYVHEIGDDGKMTYRPGKMLPGYTPVTPGDHVYRAAADGGEAWRKLREDFLGVWRKRFGPNSDAMAEEAMKKIVPTMDRNKQSGEPIFSPVVMPKGIDLPASWKSESRWNDIARYMRRYAQHMAWAEYVQNNPAGRAVFGITEDARGRKDTKNLKWTDVPDAWKGAVREGKRAYAAWAKNADPNKPPNQEILRFYDDKLVDALMMGYRQGSADAPMMQSMNQFASSALLGTLSGLRDATTAVSTAAQYGDVFTTVKSTLEYIAGGRGEKLGAARRAGAMGPDVIAPEAVEDGEKLAKGIMSAARVGRMVTGREELDLFGKTLIFDVIRSLPESKQAALMEEFGPVEKMSPEEAMAFTAARISRKMSNTSTPSNLPPSMLPQSSHPASKYLGLMRWSLGQYNNFKEDTIGPFYRGKSKEALARFLKLTIGTAVTSSLLSMVINALLDRKPDNLTWGELLNLTRDKNVPLEKKIDEFAYTTLANMQLAGAYGWVGDMMLAGVRAKAGGRTFGSPLDAQYPLLIMGVNVADTVMSYTRAVKDGRAGMADFWQLMQELMGASQNGRILNRMLEVTGLDEKEIKKPIRDSEVVRRVFGVDPKSGRPELVDRNPAKVDRDPFSPTKQALRIPEEQYKERMGGFLERYLKSRGQPVSIPRWKQWPGYYDELGRLVGEEEAKRAKEEAAELDKTVREKNRALSRASR